MPRPLRADSRPSWFAVLLLLPALALANGGPIDPDPGPGGGIAPRQETSVRLVSEQLTIRLTSGYEYHAVARYLLANDGPTRTVRYGVPFSWQDYSDPRTPPSTPRDATARARLVRITVGDRVQACELEPATRRPKTTLAEAWCVTTLEIPSGPAVPLVLEFDASLDFHGSWTNFGSGVFDSTLRYDLFPAGFWAGTAERVEVAVELGDWARHLGEVSLPGSRLDGTTLRWVFERPDLKQLGSLGVALRSAAVSRHEQLVGYDGSPNQELRRITTRSSSALPEEGDWLYEADNVLDAKARTAWCTAQGKGVGEWVELRGQAELQGPTCFLQGYAFAPGDVRDQATWLRHGRPKAVRVSECGQPKAGKVVNVPLPRWFDTSAVLLPPEPDVLTKGAGCVRLTIVEVAPGEVDSVCVSEFRPVYVCP